MNDMTNVPALNETDAPAVPVPVMIPEKFVAAVFSPFKKKFQAAKRIADKAPAYDITTTAGMAQAKTLRASFREIRTAVENERKARKAPILESGKLLDQRAAELKAEIEPMEDKYDAEIKAEEQRKENEKARKAAEERARVEAIEARIADIRATPGRMASADSAAIVKEIDRMTLVRLDPDDFQEHLEDALRAQTDAIDQLGELRTVAEAREAEQRRIAAEREELAKLRAEQEARERQAAAEAAERERLAQIERDKAAAERRAAEVAAAETRRQMEEMEAARQRDMRIMQDIKDIQARGALNVSLRALAPALDETRALVIDEETYGSMASMAQMAKDMAVASLEGKFAAALAVQLPFDHAEALAINAAGYYFSATTKRDDGQPIMCNPNGTRSVFCDVDEGGEDDQPMQPDASYIDQDEPAAPVVPSRPSNAEIIQTLAEIYDESKEVVLDWLRDLVAEAQ